MSYGPRKVQSRGRNPFRRKTEEESDRTKLLKEAYDIKRMVEGKGRNLSNNDVKRVVKFSQDLDRFEAKGNLLPSQGQMNVDDIQLLLSAQPIPEGKVRVAAIKMHPFSTYVQDFSTQDAAVRAVTVLRKEGYEVRLKDSFS